MLKLGVSSKCGCLHFYCQTPTNNKITEVGFDTKMTLHHHRELNVGNISAVTQPILMKL